MGPKSFLDHAPWNPSSLRQSYTPSNASSDSSTSRPGTSSDLFRLQLNDEAVTESGRAGPSERRRGAGDEISPLLFRQHAHEGPCNHGTFSPQARSMGDYFGDGAASPSRLPSPSPSNSDSESALPGMRGLLSAADRMDWKRRWASRMRSKTMRNTRDLAERHGVRDSSMMYLSYYLPVMIWSREYRWSYLKGDLIAAMTVACMYVPIALSLADNLAHVPAINGLYSFVFNPLMYAILGSCPAMILGPEAAGSLLVGSIIKSSVDSGRGSDEDAAMHATICGIVGAIAGATTMMAGLFRLGFMDSVLSRPFLRGFISAIGVVIAVDQLIPELGLSRLAEAQHAGHGSSVEKLCFIFANLDKVHGLTCVIAGTSFAVIMVCREVKRQLVPRYPAAAYVPDRFVIVLASALLAYVLRWEGLGVAILGEVRTANGHLFEFRWPLRPSNMQHIRDAMGTSFLIALLGFFESSVAAKSLGSGEDFAGIQLSANRELVALGAANLLGSCFMALPAFGGYGRSKVNKQTGGRSPMSSVFLSVITLTCIKFLLPWFYYMPKPVLSSMISVVAWSLIEECPHDIAFFIRISAWPELGLMSVIVLATIFYSLSLGIAIGVALSLLQVVRHATRPRIQILGRIPGTNRFENAESNPGALEFIQGCLIIKVPEPLNFANTGELKTRLRRLELYGTSQAHPALPRLRREDSNRNVVFDIHGVTWLDGSGTQVLEEILRRYRERGVRVFFSRGPARNHAVWKILERSGIVDLVGGEAHFVNDVHAALKMTEVDEGEETSVVADAGILHAHTL